MTPKEISDFVYVLRDFTKAYPESMFPALTPRESLDNSAVVSKASAAMGRHLASYMGRAADLIEQLAQDAERHSSDARHRTQAGSFLDAARGGSDGD